MKIQPHNHQRYLEETASLLYFDKPLSYSQKQYYDDKWNNDDED